MRVMVTPAILQTILGQGRRLIKQSRVPKDKVFVCHSSLFGNYNAPIPVKAATLYSRGHSEIIVVQEDPRVVSHGAIEESCLTVVTAM